MQSMFEEICVVDFVNDKRPATTSNPRNCGLEWGFLPFFRFFSFFHSLHLPFIYLNSFF